MTSWELVCPFSHRTLPFAQEYTAWVSRVRYQHPDPDSRTFNDIIWHLNETEKWLRNENKLVQITQHRYATQRSSLDDTRSVSTLYFRVRLKQAVSVLELALSRFYSVNLGSNSDKPIYYLILLVLFIRFFLI